ncbi:unnamed protein product, partial [Symbiodinium microadriaticum]
MLCNNMLGMLGSEKFSLAMAVSARPCVVRSMHTGNCEHGLYDMSAYVPGGWHGEGTRPPVSPSAPKWTRLRRAFRLGSFQICLAPQ